MGVVGMAMIANNLIARFCCHPTRKPPKLCQFFVTEVSVTAEKHDAKSVISLQDGAINGAITPMKGLVDV